LQDFLGKTSVSALETKATVWSLKRTLIPATRFSGVVAAKLKNV
jgi:hypothetical protein